MQIAGQYSSVISTTRQPANRRVEEGNAPSTSQSSHPLRLKTAEPGQLPAVLSVNRTVNRGDINSSLAAQRRVHGVFLMGLTESDITSGRMNTEQFTNQAAVKAVSEYRDVASQQQREELTEVLGVDVFA